MDVDQCRSRSERPASGEEKNSRGCCDFCSGIIRVVFQDECRIIRTSVHQVFSGRNGDGSLLRYLCGKEGVGLRAHTTRSICVVEEKSSPLLKIRYFRTASNLPFTPRKRPRIFLIDHPTRNLLRYFFLYSALYRRVGIVASRNLYKCREEDSYREMFFPTGR